jgi:hypothetical protein
MTATFAPTAHGPFTAGPLTSCEYAYALFTASLTCGCMPPKSEVMETVKSTIGTYGLRYCADTVAGEYGEHPVEAMLRMREAQGLVAGLPRMTIETKVETKA